MLFYFSISKFAVTTQNVIFLLFSGVLLSNWDAGWVWRVQMQSWPRSAQQKPKLVCFLDLCNDSKTVTRPYKIWTCLGVQGKVGWVLASVPLVYFTEQWFGSILEWGEKGKDGAKVLLDSVRSNRLGCNEWSVLVIGGWTANWWPWWCVHLGKEDLLSTEHFLHNYLSM